MSVIDTSSDTVVATITGIPGAKGVAVSPDGARAHATPGIQGANDGHAPVCCLFCRHFLGCWPGGLTNIRCGPHRNRAALASVLRSLALTPETRPTGSGTSNTSPTPWIVCVPLAESSCTPMSRPASTPTPAV